MNASTRIVVHSQLQLTELRIEFPFNLASARVLQKNGFELEGLLQSYHQKEGACVDAKLYAQVR